MSLLFFRINLLPACLLAGLLSLSFACERKTEVNPIAYGYEYFPLQVGQSWEFQVDSIIFDPAGTGTSVDSIGLWAKELVADRYITAAGDTVYRIERYERYDTTEPWAIRKVLAQWRTARQAFRQEDNLKLIKLIFPIEKGRRWNGTRHIAPEQRVVVAGEVLEMFKDWQSQILDTEQSFSTPAANFIDVIVVSHADASNLIEHRYQREIYAHQVGLVFLEQRVLDTQCRVCCNGDFARCNNLPWRSKAEKGFIVRQQLWRWGR